jgi:hypothetical protein
MKIMSLINTTIEERGSRYGSFEGQSAYAQEFKSILRSAPQWQRMKSSQKESLEMIMHKVARILNGDPNYSDSWHDIAGYAKLIDDVLIKENAEVGYER